MVQLGDFSLGKILTKKARFLPLLVVSLLERRRDEHPPGFEESKEGHLLGNSLRWCSVSAVYM